MVALGVMVPPSLLFFAGLFPLNSFLPEEVGDGRRWRHGSPLFFFPSLTSVRRAFPVSSFLPKEVGDGRCWYHGALLPLSLFDPVPRAFRHQFSRISIVRRITLGYEHLVLFCSLSPFCLSVSPTTTSFCFGGLSLTHSCCYFSLEWRPSPVSCNW